MKYSKGINAMVVISLVSFWLNSCIAAETPCITGSGDYSNGALLFNAAELSQGEAIEFDFVLSCRKRKGYSFIVGFKPIAEYVIGVNDFGKNQYYRKAAQGDGTEIKQYLIESNIEYKVVVTNITQGEEIFSRIGSQEMSPNQFAFSIFNTRQFRSTELGDSIRIRLEITADPAFFDTYEFVLASLSESIH